MRTIIGIIVLVVLLVGIYFGFLSYLDKKAEAEEAIIYVAHVMKRTEYGYVPKYDFEMSKPTLMAHLKLCWWDASWLDSGDLLLKFDADEDGWLVKLQGNDSTINEIKSMVTKYGLRCSIPER